MSDLTDPEITRPCARAMEYTFKAVNPHASGILVTGIVDEVSRYDPLHDDAQMAALVKKFRIGIVCFHDSMWSVNDRHNVSQNADLNRAVCECVARMQLVKEKARG